MTSISQLWRWYQYQRHLSVFKALISPSSRHRSYSLADDIDIKNTRLSLLHRFHSHGSDINIRNTCLHGIGFIAMAVVPTSEKNLSVFKTSISQPWRQYLKQKHLSLGPRFHSHDGSTQSKDTCLWGLDFTEMTAVPKAQTPVFRVSISQPWRQYLRQRYLSPKHRFHRNDGST